MDTDSAVWDDSYLVGHELIDSQHKELVKMTNELFEGCRQGTTAVDVAFMKTIRRAVEYALTHFSMEEKLMQQAEYPGFETHHREHETFIASVRDTVRKFEGGSEQAIGLARFLKKWLLNHIAQSDKLYAPYLAAIS